MSGFEKKISLIIPFYNSEKTLAACLASVGEQTIDKACLEVILVNDGSTDGSADIAKEFASQSTFATIITQEHSGSGAARNTGIAAARGSYIAFLDADDALSADALKNTVEFFEENDEKTDIVAYKIVPYTKSGRKKCDFKYLNRKTGIVDLNGNGNEFYCPNGLNIAVKNRGEESVLFDRSESCELKAAEYCVKYAADKMTVGYVENAEYRKFNNPSGESKDLKCSIYFDCYIGKWEEIFSSFEVVPGFVKALFLEDILARTASDCLLPYCAEGEDYRREIGRIEKLLESVDDDLIINFPDAPPMNKYYLVSMKYKGELEAVADEKIRLVYGDKVLFESDGITLNLTRFKARGNGVELCGYISSPIFDYCEKPTLILRERSENIMLDIAECSYCYDGAKIRNNTAWGFRTVIVPEKRKSFSFTVEIGERSYPVNFECGEWVAFNQKRRFFVMNGIKCRMSERCFVVEKADERDEKKYKKAELKKYLKTNKKVFAVRFINYLMPKKRIWLYHDCKGVGADNAYYQFVHDFAVDDGVERYYVVNGSIDAVRDKFTAEQQKNLIAFRSTKHKLMYLNAEKIITAFIEKENYLPYFSDIYPEYIDLFSGEVYYLQHGVLHAHLPWKYSYDRLDVTGEVVSTEYEVKNFTENYFFPEEALIKSKMPRYDYFEFNENKAENVILFAPSWRKYLIAHKGEGGWTADKEKFMQSDYFKKTQAFLNSERLDEMLEKSGYMLEFKLHPIFAPYKDCFDLKSPRVKFADGRASDEYRIFITDYSSYVFDFVYLNRAIVYFMPDLMEFKAGMNDYRELDIPFENGFGELTQSETELCAALQRIIDNSGEPVSPYKEKNAGFFFDKEKDACDRIYKSISEK